MNADLINGTIELLAGFFVLNHCRVLYIHKQARGVSMLSVAFFTLWGIWNLYYYPALNQPISFFGAVFIVAANALYMGMLVCYRNAEVFPDEHAILQRGVNSAGRRPVRWSEAERKLNVGLAVTRRKGKPNVSPDVEH